MGAWLSLNSSSYIHNVCAAFCMSIRPPIKWFKRKREPLKEMYRLLSMPANGVHIIGTIVDSCMKTAKLKVGLNDDLYEMNTFQSKVS